MGCGIKTELAFPLFPTKPAYNTKDIAVSYWALAASLTRQNSRSYPQRCEESFLSFGAGTKVFPGSRSPHFLSRQQIMTLASKLHKGFSKLGGNIKAKYSNISPELNILSDNNTKGVEITDTEINFIEKLKNI